MQDTSELKDKIVYTIRVKGPSLPVHIAKATEQSILFASAFLSELLSEGKIKTSFLRVGSSPVYFIQGQESQLEKYSQHLKSKEKDAFNLLKEEKFLKDDEQLPAIRVALRAIKDFAIPLQNSEGFFWRYFTISENEFKNNEIKTKEKLVNEPTEISREIKEEAKQDLMEQIIPQKIEKKPLDIFDKKETPIKRIEKTQKKILRKKPIQKANEKFFNKVKEFLTKKNIEISGIEGFSKTDITLRIIKQGEEKLLVAYNKKRLTEEDITNAYKKAEEMNLKYLIFSLGETSKKLNNFIEAIRNLDNIEKIE